MKKTFLGFTLLVALSLSAQAAVFFNETFTYANGALTAVAPAGTWVNFSGAANQLDVAAGRAHLTPAETEDVNRLLPGVIGIGATAYFGFDLVVATPPATGTAGNYFAHLRNSTSAVQMARVFIGPSGIAGRYRLGVANGNNAVNVVFPADLLPGTSYRVVVRYVSPPTGGPPQTTLWINPCSEQDTNRVTANDAFNPAPLNAFALRQDVNIGVLDADNLRVATTFLEVGGDAVPPTIVCPANITVNASSAAGAVVTFAAIVTDNVDPTPTLTCTPLASGSTFPIGTTTVTCRALDDCGNGASCTFLVTVRPLVPLVITCPPQMTVTTTTATGVPVTYPQPTVSGGCPPYSVVCTPPPGSVFPIGNSLVTCTVTDSCTNRRTCEFIIRVVRRVVEVDTMPSTFAQLTLALPDGSTENVSLVGPTTVHVFFEGGNEGDATDDDNDGRDEVQTQMMNLDLRGNSSLGFVQVTLDPDRPTLGGIEELVNTTPGRLDIPPFAAAGQCDSFFDVFTEIRVAGRLYRPSAPLHMQALIRHKPPAPGDTYVNPFTQPIELLDENGNPTGIRILREVHTPNPEREIDRMDFGTAQLSLRLPNGQLETVTLAGPATVEVDIPPNGAAADTDGDGRDQVVSHMTALHLAGNSSMGAVVVTLDPARPTLGEIEETVNNTPGKLDVPPFTANGTADSFFDVFVEIQVAGQTLHPAAPLHMQSVIRHKPPAPGDTYVNPFLQPIELLDANGRPTGIFVLREVHTPNPEKEIDRFPATTADVTIQLPGGATETVRLFGPTTVEVCIPPDGTAADTDADGRDQVPTRMTELNLSGPSSIGLVRITLAETSPTLGEIEEQVNNTPGKLDVPPFTPTGVADSFFDVFVDVEIGGMALHNKQALRMTSVIRHKPPAPGDEYVNPFLQPVELLDANGNRTGIFIVREVHTPNPGCTVNIRCPRDITVAATGPGGAVVNYPAPIVSGNCPPIAVTCAPPPGSPFLIGMTTVTCTATDSQNNRATCSFKITVIRRFVEVDKMPYGTAGLSLLLPNGQTEVVTLAGPTTVHVMFDGENEGDATDDDGNGRDEVKTEMVDMDLRGNSSLGPVQVVLQPDQPSLGQIEETANSQPGRLDVPPFGPPGSTADSFFDVFAEIRVAGRVFHPASPLRMAGIIRHKPPAPGDTYINPFTQPIELLDENGNPTGIRVIREVHTPNPEKEIDQMPFGTAQISITLPGGATEVVTLAGPTTVEVCIPPNGLAADTDGDGRDQVPTKMTFMDLRGSSSIGPVRATLDPARMTLGEIEETANNTPGTLDVPPFAAAGAADSFFDVFVELRVGNLVLHPAQPLHMQGIIRHKPPAPGDTYVNPFLQPIELLDANGNPTGIRIVREVHTPNPEKERDFFSYTQGKINLRHPNGQIERVIVAGPTEVLVCIPPGGTAADTDGDGLDQVPMEMVNLNLAGNSSLGPVMVMLDTDRCRTLGEIEEKVNNTPGTLDIPPFTAAGGANSRFDLCIKIVVNGRVFRPCTNALVRIESMISHKPPGPGEAYMNLINQEIPLCDENGNPTGIVLTGEMHTPNPPKEIDFFQDTLAQLTVRLPNGAEEVVTLRGPTRVEVCIDDNLGSPGYGLAADTDADGLDQVPTRMTLLNLAGPSSIGPVQVSLRADRPSLGEIEETANNTPGTLDVPPFAPVGTASSFFDIWPVITVSGQSYTTAAPLHMAAVIRHKPPAPGDEYVNPFLQPVELIDAAGNRTGIFIVREVHTPNVPCTVSILCPSNIVVWGCSPNGQRVDYPLTTATSSCNLRLDVSCVPPSGSNFPPGNNPVVCTARDPLGNSASCTFLVRVIHDTTPPVITCPSNIVLTTCRERERVTWTVSARDDCDPAPRVVCDPPSGTVFPIGSHVVTCRATDSCGNESKCEFRVEVRPVETTTPRLTITRLPNNRVMICWSTTCPGWVLQCTRSLNPPIMWEVVTNTPTTTGGQNCIILPITGRHQFYRLCKRDDPAEVYAEDDLMPPQGVYDAPGDEITVILYPAPGAPPRRILARWFVHPVPVPPIIIRRPPPCLTCPPETFQFRTDLDFQVSLDEGETWRAIHMMSDVAVQVLLGPPDTMPGVRSFDMEMVRLDAGLITPAGAADPGLRLRESPTRQSLGKHTIRQSAAGDGTHRLGSFFDVFVEVSLDGGQTWGAVQRPVHMELNSRAPQVAERADTFPPAGTYDSPPVQITRYANGILARRYRHPIPIPPIIPRPPPCLTCPPETYEFQTDLLFEFSANGGQTWQPGQASSRVAVSVIPCFLVGDAEVYDTEMRRLDAQIPIPGTPGVLLRESPTLKSRGLTRVGDSPSLSRPYLVDSFFDIFTEISLDGGQTWSRSLEPTHVELNPQPFPPGQ